MGVSENAAFPRQCIHVRRDRLRMASEESDPVVQIVDTDHEDIGSAYLCMTVPGEKH